jgi:general secretion pathway protein G
MKTTKQGIIMQEMLEQKIMTSHDSRWKKILWPFPEMEKPCQRRVLLSDHGMSLIEIIIVVALLGTLMAYMVSNLTVQADQAKIDTAKLAMGNIDQKLQMYRIHNSKYPTTDQGLNALMTAPGDAKSWRGPYIEADKLTDPWDQPFTYECGDGRTFKIMSAGPDQQAGTSDDIVYPEEKKEGAANP